MTELTEAKAKEIVREYESSHNFSNHNELSDEYGIAKGFLEGLSFARAEGKAKDEEIKSLKIARQNELMFFQVASESLGFDPSCESGKIDLMCTADAIRGLRNELQAEREKAGRLVEALKLSLDYINADEDDDDEIKTNIFCVGNEALSTYEEKSK